MIRFDVGLTNKSTAVMFWKMDGRRRARRAIVHCLVIRISASSSDITNDSCVELINFFYSCCFLLFLPFLFFFLSSFSL